MKKGQKNNSGSQFLKIDYQLLAVNKINGHKFSDQSKMVYAYLAGWKEAFPSHNKIASVFGITRPAVEKRIAKLVEMGLIRTIERKGTSNLYEIVEIDSLKFCGRSESENAGTRYGIAPFEVEEFATPDLPAESVPAPKDKPLVTKTYPWGTISCQSNGALLDCVIEWAASQGAVEDRAVIELVGQYLPYVTLDDLPGNRKNIDDFEQIPF